SSPTTTRIIARRLYGAAIDHLSRKARRKRQRAHYEASEDLAPVGVEVRRFSAVEGRSGSCAVHHSGGTIRIARSNELRSSDYASCAIATRLSRSHSSSTGPLA